MMNSPSDFVMHTFGCKVNTYDTGLIQKNLRDNFNGSANKSHVHVLNTCAVTAEATQQAVRLIRKIKSQQPFATVVVTGCAAQVDTDAFKNISGADLIIANSHKGLLPQILDQYFKGELKDKVFKSNIFHKDDLEMGGGLESHHTRSFLKIQDGCNSFCAFCIIPYARGKSRSIPVANIVARVQELEEKNIKEVVLTGVHIGDYADTLSGSAKTLEDLVESLLISTTKIRFRLSSLEPIEITSRLLELYQDARLCPHFHMSIQSAETDVLKQMKRKYDSDMVQQSLEEIAKKIPNVFIGMDVIAGFPTETDEQFEKTYSLLATAPWTRLHVFPYSERVGTRAETLPQIPFHVRKERATKLRKLSLHRYQAEALKQRGRVKSVLTLAGSKKSNGLSEDYWSVKFADAAGNQIAANEIHPIRITDVIIENSDVILSGELCHDV